MHCCTKCTSDKTIRRDVGDTRDTLPVAVYCRFSCRMVCKFILCHLMVRNCMYRVVAYQLQSMDISAVDSLALRHMVVNHLEVGVHQLC